jgi:hypothetical protein
VKDAFRHLAYISIHAGVAHGAMLDQYQRIIQVQPPRLSDGYLFVVALADVLRAANEAMKAVRPAAAADIKACIDAVPRDAKDFRNLLQHWPDYAKGNGKNADRLALTHRLAPKKVWFWWDKTDPLTLRFGSKPGGLVLDVWEAKEAANRLYWAVFDAVKDAMRFAYPGTPRRRA